MSQRVLPQRVRQKILVPALIVCLVLGLADHLRAADRDVALAVIDHAIQAQGGEERLTKSHTRERLAQGTRFLQGQEVPFTTDLILDLPERFRDTIEVTIEGKKGQIVQALNGDKGWQTSGGETTDVPDSELTYLREEAYVVWLTTLVPLKDAAFELTPLPDGKVKDQLASVIQVKSKGRPDTKLFFDKRNGWLIKIERRAKVVGLAVTREYLYADYKDFDGLRLPGKETDLVNGSIETELTITSYKVPAKVEDRLFAKP